MTQWTLIAFSGFFSYSLHTAVHPLLPEDLLTSPYPGQCSFWLFIKWNIRARQLLRAQPLKETLFSSHMFIPLNLQMLHVCEITFQFGWWNNLWCKDIGSLKSVLVYPVMFTTRRTPLRELKVLPRSQSGHMAVIIYELTHQHYEAQRKTHFPDVYLWLVSL